MTSLTLGKPFPHGSPSVPLMVSLSGSPLLCVYTIPHVRDSDIELFSSGNVEFAFCQPNTSILSFLFRIKGFCNWADSHYASCTEFFGEAGTEILTKISTHCPTNLVLVEGNTGIIKSMRMITVSHPFIYRLNKALKSVFAKNINNQQYVSLATKVMNDYSTNELVKLAKHVERGGITVN